MDQDGGARSNPVESKRPQGIQLVKPETNKSRQTELIGIAKDVVQSQYGKNPVVIKSTDFSSSIEDRRNPTFPNGFQPGAIRLMFSGSIDDTVPSDTFPGITVREQLNTLDRIKNRELIETGFGAAEQCRALGISNSNCFLCGFSLADPRLPFASPNDIGYPQCEHLLPAAASLLVFGLLDSVAEAKAYGPAYYMNYAYAHSICNREKGSRLFISMKPSEYTAEASPILEDNIRKYLDDLYTFNSVFQPLIPNKDAWISQRVIDIKAKYQPLSLSMGRLGKLAPLIGVAKYFKNIDYLYAKFTKAIKNKKEYAIRETTPSPLPTTGNGRKTLRRKHNGIVVRIKRGGNRSNSRTYRNRRTSDRGSFSSKRK